MLNLVCYATPLTREELLLKKTAEQYNIRVFMKSPKDLDTNFINKNKNILSHKQGAGF